MEMDIIRRTLSNLRVVAGPPVALWTIRFFFMFLIVIYFMRPNAQALQVVTHEKISVYFPEGEVQLANRLMQACAPMTDFLADHGLPVSLPLHVVLDDQLDKAETRLTIIPHREIRIPLKAPGVLEDGFLEPDPWSYFLFMGLATQGIYNNRSGPSSVIYWFMGELISPNVILPDWCVDGMSFLLYEKYRGRRSPSPYYDSIFNTTPIPPLDKVSNHPDIWPGRDMYRIFGRPFIRWLFDQHGWDKLQSIIEMHGGGVLPVEIDLEARKAFGASWDKLWNRFQTEFSADPINPNPVPKQGTIISGYWPEPFIYWNNSGVVPGSDRKSDRGRYGFLTKGKILWLSEYQSNGAARLFRIVDGRIHNTKWVHYWDPGPGGVVVTRQGSRPFLVVFHSEPLEGIDGLSRSSAFQTTKIEAPPGAIQISGPVMNSKGQIAVAANIEGNWDIWLYSSRWHRITHTDSIDIDPWLEDDKLLFASNVTGHFQIHTQGMRQLTNDPTHAMLPRRDTYLRMSQTGWLDAKLDLSQVPSIVLPLVDDELFDSKQLEKTDQGKPYTLWSGLKTNFLIPDIYVDAVDFQFGLATFAQDVTRRFGWDAGFRYSPKFDTYSWRIGVHADDFSFRLTRYPFSYDTERVISVYERRYDAKLAWSPAKLSPLELSANYRRYWLTSQSDEGFDEWWAALKYQQSLGYLRSEFNLDMFSNNSISLLGDFYFKYDWFFSTVLRLQVGKTWGDYVPGHNSFRIGGNVSEGIFTRRSTRLFPVRGFVPDVLDAEQAMAGGLELHWPFANLQAGYKTLPVFIRHIVLVTFLDTGLASKEVLAEEMLLSAGFEFITDLELAWVFSTDIRVGLAWPLAQPADLNQSGPTFLIQIGYPL